MINPTKIQAALDVANDKLHARYPNEWNILFNKAYRELTYNEETMNTQHHERPGSGNKSGDDKTGGFQSSSAELLSEKHKNTTGDQE